MQRFYGNDPHIIRKRRRSVRAPKGGKTGKSGRKFAVVVVLLSVILLLAVAFGAGGSKTVVRVKRKEWYFVSVLTAADSGQANVKALDIRSRGGAGYIYNDGDFSVIASVYPTEREAKAVAAKQPDPATIIKIAFSETEFPPGEYDAAVKAALALPADVVAILTGAAYDFEKGNLSESEVSFRLDSVGKEAAKTCSRARIERNNRFGVREKDSRRRFGGRRLVGRRQRVRFVVEAEVCGVRHSVRGFGTERDIRGFTVTQR